MDIVIYGYSDNLDKNYVSPPLSLYPLCTVPCIYAPKMPEKEAKSKMIEWTNMVEI